MKLLLLSALVVVVLSQPMKVANKTSDLAQWELFKIEHMKEYDSEEEEQKRMEIFMDNLKFVREHNAKYVKGEVTFDVAINKFSDMTAQEFAEKMNGLKLPADGVEGGMEFDEPEDGELPKTVDWRKKGAVTGVKDQGNCGSCWAFSTTGTIEGQMFLKTKKLVSLSEQNLVDCVDTTYGCGGGWPWLAMDYIIKNKGIDTESSYPYQGEGGADCQYKSKGKGGDVLSYVKIPRGSEKKLQQAVAKVGPVSVCIDASHPSFMQYSHGVYVEPNCSTKDLDHVVLAVGYGTVKKGGDYWLVKNSWGTDWGMKGYIMMARNHQNMCGIASTSVYPIV